MDYECYWKTIEINKALENYSSKKFYKILI